MLEKRKMNRRGREERKVFGNTIQIWTTMCGLARSHKVKTILILTLVIGYDEEWKELEQKWRKEEEEQWALYFKARRNEQARLNYLKRKEAL